MINLYFYPASESHAHLNSFWSSESVVHLLKILLFRDDIYGYVKFLISNSGRTKQDIITEKQSLLIDLISLFYCFFLLPSYISYKQHYESQISKYNSRKLMMNVLNLITHTCLGYSNLFIYI